MKTTTIMLAFVATALSTPVQPPLEGRALPPVVCKLVAGVLSKVEKDTKATSYCSSFLSIKTATAKITQPTTTTIVQTATNTVISTVTSTAETTTVFTPPETVTVVSTTTLPVGPLCAASAPVKRAIEDRAAGDGLKVLTALAKNAISTVCGCLSIPTPTSTSTVRSTATAKTTQTTTTTTYDVKRGTATVTVQFPAVTQVSWVTVAPTSTTKFFRLRVSDSSPFNQGTYLNVRSDNGGLVTPSFGSPSNTYWIDNNGRLWATTQGGTPPTLAVDGLNSQPVFFGSSGVVTESMVTPATCCVSAESTLECRPLGAATRSLFDVCPIVQNELGLFLGSELNCSSRETVLQVILASG